MTLLVVTLVSVVVTAVLAGKIPDAKEYTQDDLELKLVHVVSKIVIN